MDSLQSIFDYIKRDKYTTTDKVDANGAEHSEATGQFVSKGDSREHLQSRWVLPLN